MRLALLVACSLPLAACSNEPEVDVENASVEEVASEVGTAGGGDLFIRAGKWQTTVKVEDFSMPGMPESAKAQMKGMFESQQNVTVDYCVTPEEAKRPGGKFFTGKESANCRYEHFTMAGGKIDAVMQCQGEPSGSMRMTTSGTYTPDKSTSRVAMEIDAGGQGKMTMKAVTEARRIGECDGSET